jgi:hypothetical protein
MRSAFLIVTLLTLCASIGNAQETHVTGDTAQARIAVLVTKLRSNEVQRVEIIQMPPRMLTRTRVTPEMLERSFHYKLVIRDLRGGAYAPSLNAAVASMSAEPSAEMGDLRWGILFFDQGDQRIGSIYFDGSGGRGAVDSLAAYFRGDMFKWLDDNFSRAFK